MPGILFVVIGKLFKMALGQTPKKAKPQRPYFIYYLQDPSTRKIFYVGQTRNPKKRLESHCNSKQHNPALREILSGIIARGRTPTMVILERTTIDQVDKRERFWIAKLRERHPLVNIEDGGQGHKTDK